MSDGNDNKMALLRLRKDARDRAIKLWIVGSVFTYILLVFGIWLAIKEWETPCVLNTSIRTDIALVVLSVITFSVHLLLLPSSCCFGETAALFYEIILDLGIWLFHVTWLCLFIPTINRDKHCGPLMRDSLLAISMVILGGYFPLSAFRLHCHVSDNSRLETGRRTLRDIGPVPVSG